MILIHNFSHFSRLPSLRRFHRTLANRLKMNPSKSSRFASEPSEQPIDEDQPVWPAAAIAAPAPAARPPGEQQRRPDAGLQRPAELSWWEQWRQWQRRILIWHWLKRLVWRKWTKPARKWLLRERLSGFVTKFRRYRTLFRLWKWNKHLRRLRGLLRLSGRTVGRQQPLQSPVQPARRSFDAD